MKLSEEQKKKLRLRFVKDYSLPINIFDGKLFDYYRKLYNFFPDKVYKALLKIIEEKYDGNVDKWLEYCASFRDRAIEETMNTPEYKEFNQKDLSEYNVKLGIGERSCYNQETSGKIFISIDLKKANFQALKYVGVIKDVTYEDFVERFVGDDEYLKNSKYLRQVIFGKMNPGRIIKVEGYIMSKIYGLVHQYLEDRGFSTYSLNSDELVYIYTPNDKSPDFGLVNADYLVSEIKKKIGVDVRVELVGVHDLRIVNYKGNKVDAYTRKNLLTGEVQLKKASTTFFPQIYKLWQRKKIEENDLMFFFEDQVCTFINPLHIQGIDGDYFD